MKGLAALKGQFKPLINRSVTMPILTYTVCKTLLISRHMNDSYKSPLPPAISSKLLTPTVTSEEIEWRSNQASDELIYCQQKPDAAVIFQAACIYALCSRATLKQKNGSIPNWQFTVCSLAVSTGKLSGNFQRKTHQNFLPSCCIDLTAVCYLQQLQQNCPQFGRE